MLRLDLRQGLRPTLAGLILGLAGAVAATRVLAGFLYQVNTFDAAIFVGVCPQRSRQWRCRPLVPALRAARLQPGTAPQDE